MGVAHISRLSFWLGLAAVLGVLLPEWALAQPVATDCSKYAGLTHRMAGCVRESLDAGAAIFFTNFYPQLLAAIAAVATLAVVIYGALLAMGMVEKVGRDTFVLMLKLAAVFTFCSSSPWIYSTVIKAMDAAAFAVVSYAPPSGTADSSGSDFSQSKCLQVLISEQGAAAPGTPVIAPWLGVDCLIDSVIGIKMPPTPTVPAPTIGGTWFNDTLDSANPADARVGVSRGLLFLFFSSAETSVFGMILALVGFFYIYGMIMLIIRAFFTYISGYMAVAFLVIISPLLIPLILFRETKQYFDKWVKILISMALQPIMMMVFIVFSLTAMDFAAFSGKYSIMYRIAGDASQTAPFDLNTHLTVMRDHTGAVYSGAPPCTPNCRPIIATIAKPFAYVKASSNPTPTPIAGTAVGGVVDKLAWSRCNPKEIEKDATGVLKTICGFSYPISGMLQNVNWDVMAAARTPVVDIGTLPAVEWVENEDGTLNPDLTRGKQIAREVLSALAFCCMVVFLLNGILAVVPMITGDILGDFGQSANLSQSFAQVASNPVGNIASRVGGGAQQALGKIMGKG